MVTRAILNLDLLPSTAVHARVIPCAAAMRRLWDYLDARLPDAPRAEVDAHLATCAGCRSHVAFARAMRRALADARRPALNRDTDGRPGVNAARTDGRGG